MQECLMADCKMKESKLIDKFLNDQFSVWPLAAANVRALKECKVREMEIDGLKVKLQNNPGRIKSSAAKVDTASIAARQCFLCAENRPVEQMSLRFEGRKGRHYHILANPYPIFPSHLVIAEERHIGQSIWHKYVDMLDMAHHFTKYTIFYNGSKCGASAPDHLHFQACPRSLMPLENEADRLLYLISDDLRSRGVPNGEEESNIPEHLQDDIEYVTSVQEAQLYHYKKYTRGIFFLRSRTSKSMAKMFYRLLDCAPIAEGDNEPMFNMLTWYSPIFRDDKTILPRGDNETSPGNGKATRPAGNTHGLSPFEYRAVVIFRGSHRSHHYFSIGEDHLTLSPGCVDMAGLMILPKAEDFEKADERMIKEVLSEVSVSEAVEKDILWKLTRKQKCIEVGIMSCNEIEFEIISDGAGPQKVRFTEGKIEYNGALYDELLFEAKTMSTVFAEPTFILFGVTIGVDFHWERKRTQKFAGTLKFIVCDNKVTAVNIVGVEDYLLSVISSEMKSTASLEFLKAHAVISRSWAMSVLSGREAGGRSECPACIGDLNSVPAVVTYIDSAFSNDFEVGDTDCTEMVKWFDHEDHKLFDVCADDHCQRYQGVGIAIGDNVRKAIDATWGQVLTADGKICDARFSKCCGGVSEEFGTCWEDKDVPYLKSLPDTPEHKNGLKPFCNTSDSRILRQVLNDYDLETNDFFEWRQEYTVEEISDLIRRRSGIDFGIIQDLIPLERGKSGRISKLEIIGSAKRMIVGKELIIRKFLSESHLKSSAFEVEWQDGRLLLKGHGWGHGVGLCQIGAAVMASEGYDYRSILEHYYPGTSIERI